VFEARSKLLAVAIGHLSKASDSGSKSLTSFGIHRGYPTDIGSDVTRSIDVWFGFADQNYRTLRYS
jgi:hypothetical protein